VARGAGSSVQIIPKGKAKKGCKQSYDKWNYCIFCSKEIKRLEQEVTYPGTFSPIRSREKLLKLPCFLRNAMRE